MNANNSDTKTSYLSRSALAEKLGITLKELTQQMISAGWLLHNPDAEKGKEWQLTAKGKFEGGAYRDSKKFGQYIVWPESLIQHPVISEVKEARRSASVIAKSLGISAKMLNRLLADIGWINAYGKGWKITEQGQAQGGVQASNGETGIPYVLWARELAQSSILLGHVQQYKGERQGDQSRSSTEGTKTYLSLDGHFVSCPPHAFIANYLYLYDHSYAYQRTIHLSNNVSIISDFYLPKYAVHIHYQAQNISPSELNAQLERQQLAEAHQLALISLQLGDGKLSELEQLEQQLAKALLQAGVIAE